MSIVNEKEINIVLPPADQYFCINSWTIISYTYYIKKALESKNIKISFFDFLENKKDFKLFYKDKKKEQKNSKIYCLITFLSNRISTLKLIKKLKHAKPFCKIILVGPFASVLFEQILNRFPVDVIVLRDPEFVLPKLIVNPLEEKYLEKNFNIAYKKNNFIYQTSANLNCNLNKLPIVSPYLFQRGYSRVPIITSRGCSFKCKFCDRKYLWGDKLRYRSINKIIEEIKYLKSKFKIHEIVFDDCNFVENKKRLHNLCKEIIRNRLKISWVCSSRVDSIDIKTLSIMKCAGCEKIYYGIESGSNKILKSLGKNYSTLKIIKAVKLTKAIGVKVGIFIIVGNPGEDMRTLKATQELLVKLYPFDELNINPLILLPGTELYEKFLLQNKISKDYYLDNTKLLSFNFNWQKYKEVIKPLTNFFEICPFNTI
jgi:radical SAM superfamily enzyme YgiQ (UPF0313 family)